MVKKEMSGNLEKGFLAVIQTARNPAQYYADLLFKSMDGAGTDDHLLISTVVTRVERDMVEIKKAFFDKYLKSLGHVIKSDCGGDYKKLLLALIGEA